jgi:hypothetical protein
MSDFSEFSRADWHAQVGPALYSDNVRQSVLPVIDNLQPVQLADDEDAFEFFLNTVDIYFNSEVPDDDVLGARYLTAAEIGLLSTDKKVYHGGFADLDFSLYWASHMARMIVACEGGEGDMSVADFGALLQTKWFGDLANDAALTRPEVWDDARTLPDVTVFNLAPQEFLQRVDLPEDNLHYWRISDTARVALRKALQDYPDSVGCPVARTSFGAGEAAVKSLKRLLPDMTQTWQATRVTSTGVTIFQQGKNTAIDDILQAWGRYAHRCAANSADVPTAQRTDLGNSLLLDNGLA